MPGDWLRINCLVVSEWLMIFCAVLLCLRFCFPLLYFGANRGLSAYARYDPAGLAVAIRPGLAALCAFPLSLLLLR